MLKGEFPDGKKMLKLRFRIIFYVFTFITILFADLTIALINKYILSYNGTVGKHYITVIGMTTVLIIFYLFVTTINKLSEKCVNKFVHVTRIYPGRQIVLYISVLILFILMYAGYYWTWFDGNFFNEIWGLILSIPTRVMMFF
jgi:hypothetical protein